MKEYDRLTNLLNRKEMYRVTDMIFQSQNKINVLYIDVKELIWINHIYGHLEGDKVLIKLGKMLQNFTKEHEQFAFRIGGDEFIAIFPSLKLEELNEVAKNIFKEFKSLSISYTKDDEQTHNLNLNIDIMELSKNYFDEDDFLMRQMLHDFINNEKYKHGYKSGVFMINFDDKVIEKID